MKVYLASRYSDRLTMIAWRETLRRLGAEVTSRWINGGHEIERDAQGDEDRRRFAEEDMEDVRAADVVIVHSPREFFRTGRGGRHVEFGYALALGKRIILVGERENVFHWRVGVEVVPDFTAMLDALFGVAPRKRAIGGTSSVQREMLRELHPGSDW